MGRPRVVPIADLRTYRRRFVSAAQLADYVGVTRKTIYQHIRKGALPVHKMGGVVRIRKADALAYVGETDPHQRPLQATK
jgi:excisionase family DNA binding protein